MKNKPVYRIACSLMAAVLFLPVLAYAQYTSLSDKLTAISDELFQNGNENYILVDAVKDGIIIPGHHYNFSYLGESITFDDKPLPQSLSKTYSEKLERFFKTNNGGNMALISLRGTKMKMDDILDEQSTFRKKKDTFHAGGISTHEIDQQAIGRKQTEYTDRIIKEMVKDKLVKDTDKLKIKWDMTGVYVNDKKLKGLIADKYNTMFEKAAGFTPKKIKDGVTITRND